MSKLNWVRYTDLVQQPQIVELAKRMFTTGSEQPDRIALFMAATMVCVPVLPEHELMAAPRNPSTPPASLGTTVQGCCVFYVEVTDGPQMSSMQAFSFSVELGSSAYFRFACLMYPEANWQVDDSEEWPEELLIALAASVWLPLHNPQELG